MDSVQAFPLHWPAGRARAKNRTRANFHRKVSRQYTSSPGNYYQAKESLTVADSRDRLYREIGALGGRQVIISSNLELRLDGSPRSAQREPADPGVAVYFQFNKQPHCLSCDKWDRAADNLAAIAKHVEAMRGQLRWGVADVASMFRGFKSLPDAIITPSPMSETEAIAFVVSVTCESWAPSKMNDLYRAAARKLHPDANDGREHADWHRLQSAMEVLKPIYGAVGVQ